MNVLRADPTALPEQSPEWVDAICTSAAFRDASRSYEFADGRQFVLPLVARRGPAGVGGHFWSFPPAWGIGGPVGPGLDAGAAAAIANDLVSMRAVRVGLRVDPLEQHTWQDVRGPGISRLARRAHLIDLDPREEFVLSRMNRTTRHEIRRAQRPEFGVDVRVGTGGALLDDHYALFLQAARRWSARQHEPLAMTLWRARRRDPIEKLRAMADHLGDRFVVVVGYHDGRPASSAITLLGPTARHTRGATDTALAGNTGVNSLVQWTSIRLAIEHGSAVYNMGESGWSSGLAAYKERFGARAVEYDELRIERLPITRIDRSGRDAVKRLIRFQDPR
jgi:Acetyltransferase (GNAT) domain